MNFIQNELPHFSHQINSPKLPDATGGLEYFYICKKHSSFSQFGLNKLQERVQTHICFYFYYRKPYAIITIKHQRMTRCKLRAGACPIFLLLQLLVFASLAQSTHTNDIPPPKPISIAPSSHSALPLLQECATWSRISSGDAHVDALHSQMCNVSATEDPSTLATPPQEEAEEETVAQPPSEVILEVAPPTSQQNFAYSRDGAKVLASNPTAKKVGAILDDDSDTFMRDECKNEKWVVIELSQVAKVSRIEISQYELYSSRIKEFEVRGRQSHPRTDNVDTYKGLNSTSWKLLGKFTAERAKGSQFFTVERPLWTHYMLIRFLTHYGSEPVCAVNGLSVYGKSAAEELEDQLAEGDIGLEIENDDEEEEVDQEEREKEEEDAAAALAKILNKEKEGSADVEYQATTVNDSDMSGVESDGSGSGIGNRTSLEKNGAASPSGIGANDTGSFTVSIEQQQQHLLNGHVELENSSEGSEGGDGDSTTTAALLNAAAVAAAAEGSSSSSSPVSTSEGLLGGKNGSGAAVNNQMNNDANAPPSPSPQPSQPPSQPPSPLEEEANAPLLDRVEPLPVPKSKIGVYDALVQEIRVAKAQQRVTAKAVDTLQRNLTATSSALGRIKAQYELSDAELAARVDSLVAVHLKNIQTEVVALQQAAARASKREHASLSLVGMLGGALVLSYQGSLTQKWQKSRKAVVVLMVANGVVGLALFWQSTSIGLNYSNHHH